MDKNKESVVSSIMIESLAYPVFPTGAHATLMCWHLYGLLLLVGSFVLMCAEADVAEPLFVNMLKCVRCHH